MQCSFNYCTCGQHDNPSACLTQTALTLQDHEAQDEPAPPPDTEMLTDDAVPHANQSTSVANDQVLIQQQALQAQQPSAAPNPSIQSNFFADALAQAMAALPQQQGECWHWPASVSLPATPFSHLLGTPIKLCCHCCSLLASTNTRASCLGPCPKAS